MFNYVQLAQVDKGFFLLDDKEDVRNQSHNTNS